MSADPSQSPLDVIEPSRRSVVKGALVASAFSLPVVTTLGLGGTTVLAETPNISGQTTTVPSGSTTASATTAAPGTTAAPTTDPTTTTTENPETTASPSPTLSVTTSTTTTTTTLPSTETTQQV